VPSFSISVPFVRRWRFWLTSLPQVGITVPLVHRLQLANRVLRIRRDLIGLES
jgi:hypothetical protein